MEWLLAWGVGQATKSIFLPILEELATDVAEDAAKSYIGKAFENVFSVIHRKPLTRAAGIPSLSSTGSRLVVESSGPIPASLWMMARNMTPRFADAGSPPTRPP